MAKLPETITENIWLLKRQALEIVEEATATEFILLDLFGETEQTISYLDEMKNVAEEATYSCSRLFNVHLQVVIAQPIVSSALLKFIQQSISTIQIRIPAWERSIEEVKQEWNL